MANSNNDTEMVGVYRKSTKTKVPYKVPRSHLRFNSDLRVIPSDPSKRRKLDLEDAPEEAPVVQPDPDTGAGDEPDTNTNNGPQSGSETERK